MDCNLPVQNGNSKTGLTIFSKILFDLMKRVLLKVGLDTYLMING